MLPHLPALRRGKPYASLEQFDLKDCRTGEAKARISQVNAGIIRKDLARISESRDALRQLSGERLIGICARAATLFEKETLLTRLLHNYVVFSLQRQIYKFGIPFMIMPIAL